MNGKELNFEKAFLELKEIAEKLDDNSISLDESLKLFEEGINLSKYCNDILTKARKKIDELRNDEVDK